MPELLARPFVLWYPVIIGFLIGGALLIRRRFPDINVGVAILMLWANVINLSFVLDYFELPATSMLLFMAMFVLMLFFGTKPLEPKPPDITSTGAVTGVRLFAAWCLGAFFLILPLILVYPSDTLVTGHFVNNDIVHHSAMMRGYGYTRTVATLQSFDTYPRAFQSFAYFANALLFGSSPIPYVALPMTMFSCSLIVFALHPLLEEHPTCQNNISIVLLCVACAPFLVHCANYLLFVSQVASFPLIIGAISAILTFSPARNVFIQLLCVVTISISALSTYGLFSLSLIVFALIVRAVTSYLWPKRTCHRKTLTDRIIRHLGTPWIVASVIVSTAAFFLSVGQMIELVAQQLSPQRSENILTASGTHGFLSFAHLSGLWPPGDYRSSFTSEVGLCVFATLIAIQVALVVTRIGKSSIVLVLLTIAVPMLASRFIAGPYIHFKYLTLWVLCFPFACLVAIARDRYTLPTRLRLLQDVVIVVFVCCVLFFPMRGHDTHATLSSSDWKALETLDSEVLQRGATLILTREDWIQYFVSPQDDLAPLTQYLQRPSQRTTVDYVVLDSKYSDCFPYYLDQHPSLREELAHSPPECRRSITSRFEVVRMSCQP